MLTAELLHDALRAEGLVPPEEDVHLMACSNKWRHALVRAFGVLEAVEQDDEDDVISGLRDELEEAEHDRDEAEGKASSLEDELDEAELLAEDREKELTELREKLASLEQSAAQSTPKQKGKP